MFYLKVQGTNECRWNVFSAYLRYTGISHKTSAALLIGVSAILVNTFKATYLFTSIKEFTNRIANIFFETATLHNDVNYYSFIYNCCKNELYCFLFKF